MSIISKNCQVAFTCFYLGIESVLPHDLKEDFKRAVPSELLSIDVYREVFIKAKALALGDEGLAVESKGVPLSTLFAQIDISEALGEATSYSTTSADQKYYYMPAPLSANSIFPQINSFSKEEILEKEAKIWHDFVASLKKIPEMHKKNFPLWLDHFDTALQCFTCHLPSPYRQDISFYDYLKTLVAFAPALCEAHAKEKPFLIIQGDFFGIQDFIFSAGRETNKQAAKILRGRSFQVSLFTELAALRVLEALELPSVCQLLNAAGKFLIVAPNSATSLEKVKHIQNSINDWFIDHTYGLAGLGLATKVAGREEFAKEGFKDLMRDLFEQLEVVKLQRLDLLETTNSVQELDYPFGACPFNGYFPALESGGASLISADQIEIGKQLATKDRLIICDQEAEIYSNNKNASLKLSIFSYRVIFTEEEEITGKFGELAKTQQIKRLWDFSLPKTENELFWHGYARRYINAYVPYKDYSIKTFDAIAESDRIQNEFGEYIGQVALMTLKGDVDNLGTIFQSGMKDSNFAQMAALSRQMNQFFSLWLPAYCAEYNANMYTVFAGGDDFFLIGPWRSTQKLAYQMQKKFVEYVAYNPQVHFSAGMVMTNNASVYRMGDMAEEALEQAKNIPAKNAVTIYQRSLNWEKAQHLHDLEDEIKRLAEDYQISTSYLYSLIFLAYQAENIEKNIENSMWRSRFYYKTVRYVVDKLREESRKQALKEITTSLGDLGLEKHRGNFIIPLFNYFYLQRK